MTKAENCMDEVYRLRKDVYEKDEKIHVYTESLSKCQMVIDRLGRDYEKAQRMLNKN